MPDGFLTAVKKLIASIKMNSRYLTELVDLLDKPVDENIGEKNEIEAYVAVATDISIKCHAAVDLLAKTVEGVDEEAGRIADPEDRCLRAVMNAVRAEREAGELIDKIRKEGFFAMGEDREIFGHICEKAETQLLYVNQLLVMFASLSDAEL